MDLRRGEKLSPMFAAFLCWQLGLEPMTRPAIRMWDARPAARPLLATGPAALLALPRFNPVQANPNSAHVEGIAVYHPRGTRECTRTTDDSNSCDAQIMSEVATNDSSTGMWLLSTKTPHPWPSCIVP